MTSANTAGTPHSDEDVYATDALAALNFLDRPDERAPPPASASLQTLSTASTTSAEELGLLPPASSSSQALPAADTYKSSFTPSRTAAERRAKSAAQQEAQAVAAHQPGRSKSKRQRARMPVQQNAAWESSEEEEEEEEEEEDVDSDEDRSKPPPSARHDQQGLGQGRPAYGES
jgi:CCR4-NOT transcriptional complex subunit CAF120